MEDLTAEEKLAAEDRRQLLATAAQLSEEAGRAMLSRCFCRWRRQKLEWQDKASSRQDGKSL